MRETDSHTIQYKPISSLDLMESASRAFLKIFMEEFPENSVNISIYAGTGNNGGDGLSIARLLFLNGYKHLKVFVARFSDKATEEFNTNLQRLKLIEVPVREIHKAAEITSETADVVIDALLGSGLNKPLEGEMKELVITLNALANTIVAVDIPTGFKAEGSINPEHTAIKADLTITFQRPKINFLLPEAADFVRYFQVADIGLDEPFIQSTSGPYYLLTRHDIHSRLKTRLPFSHKGTFGHALLIAGSPETMGAALLCAGACLHTGAGLTSVCIPAAGLPALNTSLPEVMAVVRNDAGDLSSVKWEKYQAVAIGPGLGTDADSLTVVERTLKSYRKPLVIDADAINLIAAHYELMQLVPEYSVFTPHVKEFDRLFGDHKDWWSRLETGIDRAVTLGCTIILKNRFTIIFTPEGRCLFNLTGSPSMATGGMGDTLTGMVASFIAQGYRPEDAAILGVYIHGSAGESINGYVVTPSRLIDTLPVAIKRYL